VSLSQFPLHNHLRNTLPTQRLAPDKVLPPDPSQRIEDSSDEQEKRRDDQTRRLGDDREPLNDAHDEVDGGAHVIRREPADEGVEGGRGRTYA